MPQSVAVPDGILDFPSFERPYILCVPERAAQLRPFSQSVRPEESAPAAGSRLFQALFRRLEGGLGRLYTLPVGIRQPAGAAGRALAVAGTNLLRLIQSPLEFASIDQAGQRIMRRLV